MSAFETVVMVDWSGGNQGRARPQEDAIWACIGRGGVTEEPVYLRHRGAAEDWIAALIETEGAAGRRVLAGFDFPFGYPAGFARALTGSNDPRAVWRWLAARIEDRPTSNNRFDVAAEMNRAFPGIGPFWGNGLAREIPDLPEKGNARTFRWDPERRAAEQEVGAKGAFTCWQLAGAGAVGSQVLMGLPVLERLAQRLGAAIWPFEPPGRDVVFVEIWPSLLASVIAEQQRAREIRDAVQVRVLARVVSALAPERLGEMLAVDAPEEGWILGLGHEAELAALARATW